MLPGFDWPGPLRYARRLDSCMHSPANVAPKANPGVKCADSAFCAACLLSQPLLRIGECAAGTGTDSSQMQPLLRALIKMLPLATSKLPKNASGRPQVFGRGWEGFVWVRVIHSVPQRLLSERMGEWASGLVLVRTMAAATQGTTPCYA